MIKAVIKCTVKLIESNYPLISTDDPEHTVPPGTLIPAKPY